MSIKVRTRHAALVGLAIVSCEPTPLVYGPTWHERPIAWLNYPSTAQSEALCVVTLLHPRVELELQGVVAYTRTVTTAAGNHVVWPVQTQLCYGATWYDLHGRRRSHLLDGEVIGYETQLHAIGSRIEDGTRDRWPIDLAVVPHPDMNHRSIDFIDDSCERIARIEGEFAGDITIHVEPDGPECDRIPYTVRYVAQELFRR